MEQKRSPETDSSAKSAEVTRNTSVSARISGVFGCIGRTTVRFFKNIIPRTVNKYRRYMNEKNRMPKRTSKSKVYVLIGYTTKEHVDRHFRSIKIQNMIRTALLVLILIAVIVITMNWLDPFGNMDELKQIIGIDKVQDLTQEDPFGAAIEQTALWTVEESVTVTPEPSPAAA